MISIGLIAIQLLAHPYHVGVSEIKYKEEKKILQISTRVFLDDLELALGNYMRNSQLDISEEDNWEIVNKQLENYMSDNLKVYNGKNNLRVYYVGAEIENEVMWIYVEIPKVKKLGMIKVWNSILTETFEDQENIMHFRAFSRVKSRRFNRESKEHVFDWDS